MLKIPVELPPDDITGGKWLVVLKCKIMYIAGQSP